MFLHCMHQGAFHAKCEPLCYNCKSNDKQCMRAHMRLISVFIPQVYEAMDSLVLLLEHSSPGLCKKGQVRGLLSAEPR